jgi:drug/metabolite transporter (DMT)-like permease
MPGVKTDSIRADLVTRRAPLAGVLLIAAGASLWGLDGALRKPLTDTWSAYTIVLWEHIILVAVTGPYLWLHRAELRRLTRIGWLSVLVIGWGGSALATLLFTEAISMSLANLNVIVLLQKTQPLWAIAAAGIVLSERPRRQMGALLIPAAIGTYLLSFGWMSPSEAAASPQLRPALYALAAAALWGSATAFGRRGLQEVQFPVLTGLRFATALPLLFVIAAWKDAVAPPAGTDAADWLRLPLLALGSGLLAMLLYYRGLRTTPATVATIAELAFPATALIVNHVFLGYGLAGWNIVGFIILWVTIVLIYRVPVSVPRGREVAVPPPLPSGA